jgi:anti-anti-sigma factor
VDWDSTTAAVSVSRDGPDCVLALRGGFHLEHARELHAAALQIAETGGGVVVDCGEAAHLDGCAVQVLLALKKALEQSGGSLRMRGASDDVRKYLRWAGLAAHFPDDEAAHSAVEAPASGRPRKRRAASRKRVT